MGSRQRGRLGWWWWGVCVCGLAVVRTHTDQLAGGLAGKDTSGSTPRRLQRCYNQDRKARMHPHLDMRRPQPSPGHTPPPTPGWPSPREARLLVHPHTHCRTLHCQCWRHPLYLHQHLHQCRHLGHQRLGHTHVTKKKTRGGEGVGNILTHQTGTQRWFVLGGRGTCFPAPSPSHKECAHLRLRRERNWGRACAPVRARGLEHTSASTAAQLE
jgi:hypothetical protein